MDLRSRLSYANVAATLALVLALGGGTVYAAAQLGKNDVKSKNIAKGAVKKGDLGKNAVISSKVKNGEIKAGDIAAGVIPQIQADVTGSATAGPQDVVADDDASVPIPLNGTTTFTPQAGEVAALTAEARFSVATTTVGEFCSTGISMFLNGERTRAFVGPEEGIDSLTLTQQLGRDADGPFGLINPGTPLTLTAELNGDDHCTAGTQLERLEIRILQIR